MRTFVGRVLAHPLVLATLAVAAVGGLLEATGPAGAARWVVSAFAVVVALVQARGMVDDLRAGNHGIDLLAVTAIVSTVAVGEYWAALVVCLMLTGGEALEDYAAGRAKRELTGLLQNAPRTAHRLGPDGQPTDVPVEDVVVGDRLLVRPFEAVPVDGLLESPDATLDESSLTGESLPVDHARGDALLSGSVNGGEAIELRATAAAADSQYQRIVALVREAQDSKAPFVRLADRVAVPFTIGALALAVGAWLVSGDPSRIAEVLVVATPCPLIIAAPVAFMAGMSRSARAGIIVKSSGTLEQLARARTVAFDKTGTLTHGEPRVTEVHAEGMTPAELLVLAAAVEQYSSHPLADAVVDRARQDGLVVPAAEDVVEVPAHGMRGTVGGRVVVVGSARYVARETGVAPPQADGVTGVHVAVDGRPAGRLTLADELRPETRATMAALHRAGVGTVMMLTGDGAQVARRVAAEAGIDDVRAELLPQDKVDAIRTAPRRPVMMVGDGVNDAPVLAAADVGIAMGARGASAASESADVVVTVDDLSRVARAVQIGDRTLRVAWQAIGIGVVLSVGLMLVAAAGALPALAGAWLQEAVDLTTILWALLAVRPSRSERAATARMTTDLARSATAPRRPPAPTRRA
ncbi:heavy metal translocating P-type ATPase [Cellulomonas dongxiuzhuiae]|uniref:heavy metal translocating P-type ATPase n=2 Tax=Cellulomonas dongxiuzhuiae TaxID=2819979 RepID=UPI001AAE23C2|nr:heavy metal translocating P-type ATPase [Cellulomonas dongxiuzhuiae]MBO3090030.1 cadmium-translocating P-type ATPase [Cellulomonas dongxiuzhuiae]